MYSWVARTLVRKSTWISPFLHNRSSNSFPSPFDPSDLSLIPPTLRLDSAAVGDTNRKPPSSHSLNNSAQVEKSCWQTYHRVMLETRNVQVSIAWEKRRRGGLHWYCTGNVLGHGVRTSVWQNPIDNDKPCLWRGCTA